MGQVNHHFRHIYNICTALCMTSEHHQGHNMAPVSSKLGFTMPLCLQNLMPFDPQFSFKNALASSTLSLNLRIS